MKAALLIVVLPVLLVSAFGANAQRIIDTRPICKGGLFEKVQNFLSPGCQTQDEYDAQMQAERNFARWCANTPKTSGNLMQRRGCPTAEDECSSLSGDSTAFGRAGKKRCEEIESRSAYQSCISEIR